jgi:ABC-type methionine transport system permease subunit
LPGVLALGLHSAGMVGKFFAEAIEHVDPRPIEAAEAAGATRLQIIQHAILPQVLPQFADVAVYRWEYNFRASTVMGMVGAGGIGFELMASLRIMNYSEVSAILIAILVMVSGMYIQQSARGNRSQSFQAHLRHVVLTEDAFILIVYRNQDNHPIGLHAPGDESEHISRRTVQPLRVINE